MARRDRPVGTRSRRRRSTSAPTSSGSRSTRGTPRGLRRGHERSGQGGVLLRYGKTWTEETELPPQVQGAGFTAIAFAGSEAIVAYSKRPNPRATSSSAGCSSTKAPGWHVDQEAEAVAGGAVPRRGRGAARRRRGVRRSARAEVSGCTSANRRLAVAGRPDPAAEFAGRLARAVPRRRCAARDRDGGRRRPVRCTGGLTPGFPPILIPPSGVFSGAESGGVLRQTADGWRDESHELNPVGAPRRRPTIYHDLPYRPDPIYAVLIDPTGTQGWAVGGIAQQRRTARRDGQRRALPGRRRDATRAPVPPPVPTSRRTATFAFGGGAQCAAPCADRELAACGPAGVAASALALASGIGSELRRPPWAPSSISGRP